MLGLKPAALGAAFLGTAATMTLTAASAQAMAGLRLGIDDGSGGINWTNVLSDGDGDGVLTFAGGVGNMTVDVTTGTTKPAVGSASQPVLGVESLNISGGAGTVYIQFSDIDFTGTLPFMSTLTFNNVTGGGTVEATSYFDESNDLYGLDSIIGDHGSFSGSIPSADVLYGGPSGSTPYSLTTFLTITHNGPNQLSTSSLQVNAVPEPLTILGAGTAIAFGGAFKRKLGKKDKKGSTKA